MSEENNKKIKINDLENVTGGGGYWDEEGNRIWDVERCEACGGEYIINFCSGAYLYLKCKKCGKDLIALQ